MVMFSLLFNMFSLLFNKIWSRNNYAYSNCTKVGNFTHWVVVAKRDTTANRLTFKFYNSALLMFKS